MSDAAAAIPNRVVRAWMLYTLNDLGTRDRVVGLFASEELANQVGAAKLGGSPFEIKKTFIEMPRVYQTMQEFDHREQEQCLRQLAEMLTPEQIALVRSAAFDPYATI
jgi:hypothetical protein